MIRQAAVRGLVASLLAAAASGAAAVSCSVESAGLSFGSYNPFRGAPNDSVGTISMTCSGSAGNEVVYVMRIGPGSSGSPREGSAGCFCKPVATPIAIDIRG